MPGGCSECQVMGMIKGFFWVSNFQFWDFWGVGKFGRFFFFGWLDLCRDYLENFCVTLEIFEAQKLCMGFFVG